jgi:TonB family protein
MSEDWVQWQGHIINGEFQLGEYLGGSEHSAVFLTELSDAEPQKVAIKFIFAHSPDAELRFARWKMAAKLSHPRLIRIFRTGRCELGNSSLLYAVMEFADEDVGQVLPHRALTPAEARDVLAPVLEALSYLHTQGFIHGHIEPANILAARDQVKLSGDALIPVAESDRPAKLPSPYDPPEYAAGSVSPAGDAWSLGMTLVEILTQRLPVWDPAAVNSRNLKQPDPALPETLPSPFLEIARNCLRLEAELRWKVPDIVARLNPTAAKAMPARVAAPVAPPKPAPPVAAERKPAPIDKKPTPPAPAMPAPQARKQASGKKMDFAKSWPIVAGAAAAGALIAILVVPRFFNHASDVQRSAALSEQLAPLSTTDSAPAVSHVPSKIEKRAAKESSKQKAARQNSLQAGREKEPKAATASPASLRTDSAANVAGGLQPGEVFDDVLPQVPQKARDTIHGKVRVGIKIHVDELGNVAGVDFTSRGPSKYFADLALRAAQRWQFAPAKSGGQNVASDWILRFEFSRNDTKVFPKQAAL